ncbi:hypothetical protein [Wukongibacter sp. M2B1]|uniref:hypothetical protein n=1 Tax=Wukongibacter sp. M2B1 TaxID=3088895 RepID=UPI003D792604
MNKTKKIIIILVILVTLIFAVDAMFLFNPLTFKRDAITHHHYTRYRKPMVYIVSLYGDDKKIDNGNDDVRKMYQELKQSEFIGFAFDEDLKKQLGLTEERGKIMIKSELKFVGTLSEIAWYGSDSDICRISMSDPSTGYRLDFDGFIKMTPELKVHINSLFK